MTNEKITLILDGVNTAFVLFLFCYSMCVYRLSSKIYSNNPNKYHLIDIKIVELSIFVFSIYSMVQIFYCLLPKSHYTIYVYDNLAFSGLLYLVYLVLHKIYLRTADQISKPKA